MAQVGMLVRQNRKYGGSYIVIGKINCTRCERITELREQQSPSKNHRKIGHYWSQWFLCQHCGLYEGDRKIIVV